MTGFRSSEMPEMPPPDPSCCICQWVWGVDIADDECDDGRHIACAHHSWVLVVEALRPQYTMAELAEIMASAGGPTE